MNRKVKDRDEKLEQNILYLLKYDANNLLNKLVDRKHDYLMEFSLKRTREHFKDIFQNRYELTTIEDLKYCPPLVIDAMDAYYTKVDELKWYLNHTQDMVNTVEDKINSSLRIIKKKHSAFLEAIEHELKALENPVEQSPVSKLTPMQILDDGHDLNFDLNNSLAGNLELLSAEQAEVVYKQSLETLENIESLELADPIGSAATAENGENLLFEDIPLDLPATSEHLSLEKMVPLEPLLPPELPILRPSSKNKNE